MKLRYLLLFILLHLSLASATLPPTVKEILPPAGSVVSPGTSFWLYGPNLSSFPLDKVKLIDVSSGKKVSISVDVTTPGYDYTHYGWNRDWRGLAGESGELEILEVSPSHPLKPDSDYRLTVDGKTADFKTGPQANPPAPTPPTVLKATREARDGHDFMGEPLTQTEITFTVEPSSLPRVIQVHDAETQTPLAFCLVPGTNAADAQEHSISTPSTPRRITLSVKTLEGKEAYSSEQPVEGTILPLKKAVKILLAVFLVGGLLSLVHWLWTNRKKS